MIMNIYYSFLITSISLSLMTSCANHNQCVSLDNHIAAISNSHMSHTELMNILTIERWLSHKYIGNNAIMCTFSNASICDPVIRVSNNVNVYKFPDYLEYPEVYKYFATRYNLLKIDEADYLYSNGYTDRAKNIIECLALYSPDLINYTSSRISDITAKMPYNEYSDKYRKNSRGYIEEESRWFFGKRITTNDVIDISVELELSNNETNCQPRAAGYGRSASDPKR